MTLTDFQLVHSVLDPRTYEETFIPCRTNDPELWFPDGRKLIEGDVASEYARALCAGCPFIVSCLEKALDLGDQHGIWGGTTREERRKMLREGWRP